MIVDAENVRRSLWPNLGRDDLVALCGARAAAEGVDVIVVFDGPPPACVAPAGVFLAGEPGRSAEDLVVELARARPADGLVVVTSDRALRARLPRGVEVVGGGRFARSLVRR